MTRRPAPTPRGSAAAARRGAASGRRAARARQALACGRLADTAHRGARGTAEWSDAAWGGPLTSGDPRVTGDPPTDPRGFPPVPAFSPAALHPAEAAALAGAFAVDYLSWDEDDPERRGRVLVDYLPTPGRDPARLGWAGKGRQRAEFALPGPGAIRGRRSRAGRRPRARHPVRPGRRPPPKPRARRRQRRRRTSPRRPRRTSRGWRSVASTWIRMSVPVTFDGGRMVWTPGTRRSARSHRRPPAPPPVPTTTRWPTTIRCTSPSPAVPGDRGPSCRARRRPPGTRKPSAPQASCRLARAARMRARSEDRWRLRALQGPAAAMVAVVAAVVLACVQPAAAAVPSDVVSGVAAAVLPALARQSLPLISDLTAAECPELPPLWVVAQVQAESGWDAGRARRSARRLGRSLPARPVGLGQRGREPVGLRPARGRRGRPQPGGAPARRDPVGLREPARRHRAPREPPASPPPRSTRCWSATSRAARGSPTAARASRRRARRAATTAAPSSSAATSRPCTTTWVASASMDGRLRRPCDGSGCRALPTRHRVGGRRHRLPSARPDRQRLPHRRHAARPRRGGRGVRRLAERPGRPHRGLLGPARLEPEQRPLPRQGLRLHGHQARHLRAGRRARQRLGARRMAARQRRPRCR